MVFALIQTGSVSLTKWTTYLPCRGLYADPCTSANFRELKA